MRENFCDFTFVNTFVEQDFVNRNKLFVTGRRLNQNKMVWEYYVKSRNAQEYRRMLLETLYHPPHIEIDIQKAKAGWLYLYHHFEGKPLVKEYIGNTMLGIEYLWGRPVQLETSEIVYESFGPKGPRSGSMPEEPVEMDIKWERVRYTMKDRKLSREVIEQTIEK